MKVTEAQYQEAFIEFRAELSSYVFRLLTNKQNTEDIVQDTFVKALEKLDTFEGRSGLKTWVFTIATNLAKNLLKSESRWVENAQDYGAALHMQSPEHWDAFKAVYDATPEQQYEVREHINYCFNCINKTLLIEQQVCLLLKEVYAFKVSEIMQITGMSEGKVKHAIADARKNMVRIFDNRCAFVNKNGVCHQCTELTGILNPKQNAQVQANAIKMVREDSTDKEHLLALRLELVQSIDPLNAPNSRQNIYMLGNCEKWVETGKAKNVLESRPK